MQKTKLRKKGQSTVEYVVLVAGVLAVIVFFTVSSSSPFRVAFNNALTTGSDGMTKMANRLATSRP